MTDSHAPADDVRCLRGEALYGDDFAPEDIARWVEEEKEGYSGLGAADRSSYRYQYEALNDYHAFRHLPNRRFGRILGFGSAYGAELLPIVPRSDHVTIIDPSDCFAETMIRDVPVQYAHPNADGSISFDAGTFDVTVCFGVLHHIPNVSHVFAELCRVTRPGGYLLIREPIVSMGDWRHPRQGLTRNERGIPLGVFKSLIKRDDLKVHRLALCDFAPMAKFSALMGLSVFNSPSATWLDARLATLFSWNLRYHATTTLDRFRPSSVSLVLERT